MDPDGIRALRFGGFNALYTALLYFAFIRSKIARMIFLPMFINVAIECKFVFVNKVDWGISLWTFGQFEGSFGWVLDENRGILGDYLVDVWRMFGVLVCKCLKCLFGKYSEYLFVGYPKQSTSNYIKQLFPEYSKYLLIIYILNTLRIICYSSQHSNTSQRKRSPHVANTSKSATSK